MTNRQKQKLIEKNPKDNESSKLQKRKQKQIQKYNKTI